MSVRTVVFHPQDATQVCVVGPGVFRLLRYVDNTIKQLPFHKLDTQTFLCQVQCVLRGSSHWLGMAFGRAHGHRDRQRTRASF
jgi:hypothetical protein